ncbi:hypothetical protein N473_06985 [Pseudoalteromonas luteoviolacea CPMOR-1]|uniref:DUF2730 domain-containing protein n=1 Tax=Pseudoalteromonas luteoviolacea CPMOR-1 TaxID=1365248 RepID=A0A167H475_9GAMM|nr:DUF2730 family protein [Pseudoalteromonas luteoviolacea]KZN57613.1 hypothetical protein N473_06985 [Pseudoalteromonas luteoviolacea CPMOR-1]
MLDFFEKWQTVIMGALGTLGVLIMAFLYIRFPSRPEFNKHKTQTTEQISHLKAAVTEQLAEHKAELQEQISVVKGDIKEDVKELENQLAKVPTSEDLHALELKIERLNTNIESVKPGLSSVTRLTDLLMENELREKRND